MVKVVTNIKTTYESLEGKLKGLPSSMRQALLESLENGKPLPPTLSGIANDIRASEKTYLTQLFRLTTPRRIRRPTRSATRCSSWGISKRWPLLDRLFLEPSALKPRRVRFRQPGPGRDPR